MVCVKLYGYIKVRSSFFFVLLSCVGRGLFGGLSLVQKESYQVSLAGRQSGKKFHKLKVLKKHPVFEEFKVLSRTVDPRRREEWSRVSSAYAMLMCNFEMLTVEG
jgi:hypothetical protein